MTNAKSQPRLRSTTPKRGHAPSPNPPPFPLFCLVPTPPPPCVFLGTVAARRPSPSLRRTETARHACATKATFENDRRDARAERQPRVRTRTPCRARTARPHLPMRAARASGAIVLPCPVLRGLHPRPPAHRPLTNTLRARPGLGAHHRSPIAARSSVEAARSESMRTAMSPTRDDRDADAAREHASPSTAPLPHAPFGARAGSPRAEPDDPSVEDVRAAKAFLPLSARFLDVSDDLWCGALRS